MHPPNYDLARAITADRRQTAVRWAITALARAGPRPPVDASPLTHRLLRRLAGGLRHTAQPRG